MLSFCLSSLSHSRSSGCARLGGEVGPPLGVVVEEVAVLVVLVRRHHHAVRAAVCRAVDDEVLGAIEEETGPAAVRRVPLGLLGALPVHAIGALGIISCRLPLPDLIGWRNLKARTQECRD